MSYEQIQDGLFEKRDVFATWLTGKKFEFFLQLCL